MFWNSGLTRYFGLKAGIRTLNTPIGCKALRGGSKFADILSIKRKAIFDGEPSVLDCGTATCTYCARWPASGCTEAALSEALNTHKNSE
jgi:hypothetical protein